MLGSHQRWKLHKNDPFYYDDDVNDVNDVHNVNVDDDDDAGKKIISFFRKRAETVSAEIVIISLFNSRFNELLKRNYKSFRR